MIILNVSDICVELQMTYTCILNTAIYHDVSYAQVAYQHNHFISIYVVQVFTSHVAMNNRMPTELYYNR